MSVGTARAAVLALLADRAADATLCPSEVARALVRRSGPDGAPDPWRERMPDVHAAVDALIAEAVVEISWKGQVMAARRGPYRIGRRRTD